MDPVHADILKGTEVGLALSGAMWGVTTMQTFSYFQRFKSDSMYLKLAVRDNRKIPFGCYNAISLVGWSHLVHYFLMLELAFILSEHRITDTIYIYLEVIGIHRLIQAVSHGTYTQVVTSEMPMAAMCASVNTFLVQVRPYSRYGMKVLMAWNHSSSTLPEYTYYGARFTYPYYVD